MKDTGKLKTSWTKYYTVQMIEIICNGTIENYLSGQEKFEKSVLLSVLGLRQQSDSLPDYWTKIYQYPKQVRLFSLVAALTTNYSVIKKFAEKYTEKGEMSGTFQVDNGKEGTNIRSALVISGASLENYRKENIVPFNFAPLFENGEVGILAKELYKNRLIRIGYIPSEIDDLSDLANACFQYDFVQALGLTKVQFEKWLSGTGLNLAEEIFQFSQLKIYKEIPMLKVHQWMNDWDDIDFKSPLRSKPKPFFYMFNIDARLLKKLSDVHRRKPDGNRGDDILVQRDKNDQRVGEIRKYIEGGFPWSTISRQEQKLAENADLKMPGLLPTAIIANIIGPGQNRNGRNLDKKDQLSIKDEDGIMPRLIIPDHIFDNSQWNPELKPIEIIDGQHRLWAFNENQSLSGNYEFPVIAFFDLDRAWQAYLFYTINIKPVKINTSLGFDLYPLLRTQTWLENSKDGLLAYRETRAQEIVEALWLYQDSPWYQRINMIGEAGGPTMSQAAFIRALVNSFFKRSAGLYSDKLNDNYKIIDWNRAQQAAFIILLWRYIARDIKACEKPWAVSLRSDEKQAALFEDQKNDDLAFVGKNSFLSRDQGVRGVMLFANDFFYTAARFGDIDFNSFIWEDDLDEQSISNENISKALQLFESNRKLKKLIGDLTNAIANVDWRTSSADFQIDSEKEYQMRYKGSSGYGEFWREILKTLRNSNDALVTKYANQLAHQ